VTFRTNAFAVVGAAVAVLGLASCSATNPGIPTPTSSGNGSDSAANTTTPAVSADWWKAVNACTLLDQATATQWGYPQPGQIQDGEAFNCMWTAPNGSVLGITLEGQSYDSLPANMGQLSDLTIAGRPAKQDAQAGGDPHGCDIAVQATAGSDAFIGVNTLNSTVAQACQIAQGIATAVAPKLPGGSK
jgi:hypothetical protein